MKVSCSFSCFLLLSLGACSPPRYSREDAEAAEERQPPWLWVMEALKLRRSAVDLQGLPSTAREPQGFGKEQTGTRFRFGRQQGGQRDGNEAINFLPEEADREQWNDILGSLAEELNGYHRKKGGFRFRFGRRRRVACF
ncbi:orexigenic neuropeptide QRFP [Hemicordylus capensis]|uniref:orexigenic neuropeptide QRFP n=1 Tax=Hemicordylus capensis TaxID=884348 RepID=UPI002304B9CC|nr:orexigenic neuropeptide QRFP [Hemicordylus capensis]